MVKNEQLYESKIMPTTINQSNGFGELTGLDRSTFNSYRTEAKRYQAPQLKVAIQ